MVENSIDAGSTTVEVVLQEAGLKMIEISDNGCGIDVTALHCIRNYIITCKAEDFSLLCERHATSKIQTYDDMRNVSTFGFRGEALASISFVSKMVVKTKKKEDEFGVQGQFENGVLKFQEGQDELEMIFKPDGTDILVI